LHDTQVMLSDDPFSKRLFKEKQFLFDLIEFAVKGSFKPYDSYIKASIKGKDKIEWRLRTCRELIKSMKKGFTGNDMNVWIKTIPCNRVIVGGPICAHIDDNGDFHISDGHHRMAVLKALNIPIPIRILLRADGWLRLKQNAYAIYNAKKTYQRFDHPDFAGWMTLRDDSRVEKIKPFIKGVVVNLGCAEGYLDLKLSEYAPQGWASVENNSVRGRFAELQLNGSNASYVNADFNKWEIPKCDCLLLLSVWHHIYKKNKQEAKAILKRVCNKADRLIFDMAEPGEAIWGSVKAPKMPDFILKNTNYKKVVTIDDRRKIMIFEK